MSQHEHTIAQQWYRLRKHIVPQWLLIALETVHVVKPEDVPAAVENILSHQQ